MLNSGEVFAGYTVERLLGQGGMGSVYLARHPRFSRQTALKLLNRELFADAEVRARFEREADLAAHLDHPNIVTVYDRGSEHDQLWIAMQYIDGVDAAAVNPMTLPPERAVQIIEGVAEALDYAHGQGVLHRDVKPANIMLARSVGGQGERVFLTDFGIARLREDSTHLTQTGMFTATLAYASPEQMTGAHLDHRSDQYSLACALYWLLAGVGPFDADNPADIIRGHLQLALPPLAVRRPGLNPALDAVLAAGMAKRPEHRYNTCSEFAAAAKHALTTTSGPRLPVPPPQPPAATMAVNPAYPPPQTAPYPGPIPPPAQHIPPPQPIPVHPVPGYAAPHGPVPVSAAPGYPGAVPHGQVAAQPASGYAGGTPQNPPVRGYAGGVPANPVAAGHGTAGPDVGQQDPIAAAEPGSGGPDLVDEPAPGPGVGQRPSAGAGTPAPSPPDAVPAVEAGSAVGSSPPARPADAPPLPVPVGAGQPPVVPPPGYPPQYGPNHGAPAPRPSRGYSGLIAVLVVGLTVMVVVAVGLIAVLVIDSEPSADTAASPATSMPPAASPVPDADSLAASRRAFPNLLPQDSGLWGEGYQDSECTARRPADGIRLKDEPLRSSSWVVAWECEREVNDADHMSYTILGYESPAAARAVVARLPLSTATQGHKAGAPHTQHTWIVADPLGPLQPYYYTAKMVVSFENDPTRANYLLYVSHAGTSKHPQAAQPSADVRLADWWSLAPL
ncbi:protein kinase [Nocardia sp. NPDC050710]|uniref:serine/threonine-protein kinase n=1 Tax=Nocardia sp. NPDC050710 TaxID=3157220 RepID=UPI0033CD6C02